MSRYRGRGPRSSCTTRLEGVHNEIIWYLGPVNHMPGLDFVSAINAAPVLLVGVAVAVLAVALTLAIGARITQPAR